MSQNDLVELIHDLQNQLSKRGAAGFRTLELAFQVNDRDGNGIFDFSELESILGKAGLFLKRQSLTKLYRYFDREQNERVKYADVLDAIRGPLPPRRSNILNQVFDVLDENQHGAVDIERIIRTFDPTRHPQVLSGEKKVHELSREFANAFDGAGALNNGAVTRGEFIKFYSGISAAIPYDDDYFVSVVERCWRVKESIPASLVSGLLGRSKAAESLAPSSRTPLLARVRDIFREKIRQKTRNTKSEVENLRLVLQHFDLANTQLIDFNSFKRAIERFGIYLDDKTIQALFAEFDDGTGRMDYLAFATALYADDTTSAAFHQFQRSQALKASQQLAAESARPDSRREYLDSSKVLVSLPVSSSSPYSSRTLPSSTLAAPLARRTLSQKERENSVLPTVVFLFGGPGVGKATQAARIVREFGFVHLSLPALARAEQQVRSSHIGKQISAALENGERIPTSIAIDLLSKAIQDNVNKGSLYFICDGFPSTLSDRGSWDSSMFGRCETPFAIYLESSQSVMEMRLASRATQTGVPIERGIKARFGAFAQDTIPVVNSYGSEGRLQVVDASGVPDDVYQQIQKIIAEL